MKFVTSTDAQNNFGDLLMDAQKEPVAITRNGKEKGVLLSSETYKAMKEKLLQTAITDGLQSGDSSPLDINEVKTAARKRMGLDVTNK